ncbi:short-chain dehydrogenase [Prauserella sp. PE36]|uniref:Glucose 1-dehydrogenase n=1 Tax=Prauserella endophytica TaxID=1592324 RepID=A0ABY2SAF2_9PSEU|nr:MULTISPECIES: glucose 1-dehydrogenase [Prauserella]PXY29185.1 short-chain dehydrogenase [Prauserella coralliicola]RBM21535.1 short-chain dehydrogenase [Prauserella sp. PE36]TKG72875.1 glucose 1-dehydrogenase [Prauserella endophytica]
MPNVLDLFRLDGKVAVVTGASSGLGAGFAVALAQAGADVVLAARRTDRLSEVAGRVRAEGTRALTVAADVTDPDSCTAMVEAATGEFGRVDVLVNNAGVGTAVPALRESPDEFRRVIDVNLNGAYWAAQACGRVMEPGSSIVNISSVLALVKSYAPQAAYAASKAGVLGLTRDLAQQWSGRKGIRVNAIAPGYFASEMTEEIPDDVLLPFLKQASPLGRLGVQHELDAAVVFLASRASSYITGVTLAVDGGMSGH